MEDLDQILLEQWQSAKRRKKLIGRLKKLIKDPWLDAGEIQIDSFMKYCENNMRDKSIITKKINKKKKDKNVDVLARNPLYEAWRSAFMMTVFSYNVFTETMGRYWTFYKKDNNEKNSKES